MNNKILKLGVFLGVVAALAGGALSFVNGITAPIIEENNLALEMATLSEMYPEAKDDEFEAIEVDVDNKQIQKIYKYDDFYIFNMEVPGYKEGTKFLVSISSSTNIIDKFVTLSNGDTKGLGSKVTEEPFKESVEGNDASEELDTISGATVTSTPVVEGINDAADVMKGIE